MKKRVFPAVALVVVALTLVAAPMASAIVLYTCEDCRSPSIALKCIARSGPCDGQLITCFEWFNSCWSLHLAPPVGSSASEEAFLRSLETQAIQFHDKTQSAESVQ